MLPKGGAVRYGGWCSFSAYIAHFSQKSKLYGRAKANFWHATLVKFQSLVNNPGDRGQNFERALSTQSAGTFDRNLPLVAGAGIGRKMLLELVGHVLPGLGVRLRVILRRVIV